MHMNIEKFQEIRTENMKFMKTALSSAYSALGKCQRLWIDLLRPLRPSKKSRARKSKKAQEIDAIQSKGDRFLSRLYRLGKADHNQPFNMYEIGKAIGLGEFETEEIVNNLARAELIKRDKASEGVVITPYGIMIKDGDIIVGYAPVH